MIFDNIHADPADWRMGLFFAAEALDRAGLTLQGSRLRDARTPREGAHEADAAGLVCLSVSMVGHHNAARLRAEAAGPDVPDWKQRMLKDWAFGATLNGMMIPQDACRAAHTLCVRASVDREIMRAAIEAEEAEDET